MKKFILAVTLWLLPLAAWAQTPPTPGLASVILGNATLAVTNASGNVAIPSGSQVVTLLNDGSKELYYTGGGSTVTATTSNIPLPPGACWSMVVQSGAGVTYIAAITGGADTTTLRVIGSNGGLNASCPTASTTISGTISSNLAQVNGATVNVGTGASSTGTQRVAVASDSNIAEETGGNLASLNTNTVPPYAPIQTQFVQRPANTTTYTASTAWNTATSGSSPGYLTFTNVCRTNGGAVYLNDVNILDSANQTLKLSGVIWVYDTAPAVINDDVAYNIAFSLTGSPPAQTITGDLANSKPPITFSLSNVANAGSGASGAMEQDVPVNAIYHCASGSTSLYAQVEVTNAYVPVASEVLGIRIKYTALN